MEKRIYTLIALLVITFITHESQAFYSQKGKSYAYANLGYAISQVNFSAAGSISGQDITGQSSKRNYNKTLEIGVGKHITDSLRSDIAASIYVGKKKSSMTINNSSNFRVKIRSYALLWNMYYNLLLHSQATPYIMGGIGFGQQNVSLTDPLTKYNKSQGSLLYSLGAGLDWHLGAQWDLSVGYRFTVFANSKPFTVNSNASSESYTAKIKTRNNQSILLGLRKTF